MSGAGEGAMETDVQKVGDCWYCGGYVATDDEHVTTGSLVYHRGCAERLRDTLDMVLR